MAVNFAENRPQGAWRRSALRDVSVFIFMEYINSGVQRCIQNQLVKHRRWSFLVKGVNGSWSLIVFTKNLLLGCLISECTSRVFQIALRDGGGVGGRGKIFFFLGGIYTRNFFSIF